jgi:predicted nucleotidyltransferase
MFSYSIMLTPPSRRCRTAVQGGDYHIIQRRGRRWELFRWVYNCVMPTNIKNLLAELKKGLTDVYGERLKAIYLFGSYARGDYEESSDVDVMVVLSDYENYGAEIDRSGELVSRLSLAYGISISRVIMKEIQWQVSDTPLLRNIRAEGVRA